MTKAEETFDSIYECIAPRLNQLGPISANDAWRVCRKQITIGYGSIRNVFQECMRGMMEQGKARVVKRGKYIIIKPNTPQR